MASNREDRFAEAALMAEALRELKLRPPTEAHILHQERHTPGSSEQSEEVSSKRLQTPFPRFLGLDLPQIVPASEAPGSSDPTKQQTSPLTSDYDTRAELPLQSLSPAQEEESVYAPELPDITPNT